MTIDLPEVTEIVVRSIQGENKDNCGYVTYTRTIHICTETGEVELNLSSHILRNLIIQEPAL